jgi:26S proteasome regulatory subunit N10
MTAERQAVLVLFDNSLSSLNGDFSPTRLTAQTDTIEVLARLYLDGNPESVFGYGVLAGTPGVTISLCRDIPRIQHSLADVQRAGCVDLDTAVRVAIFGLHRDPKRINKHHLIVLLASSHGLTAPEALGSLISRDGIDFDLIVFGDDRIDQAPLQSLVEAAHGHLIRIPPGVDSLSDAVQTSLLTHMDPAPRAHDAQLQEAMRLSLQDQDREMQAAIERSIIEQKRVEEQEDDEEKEEEEEEEEDDEESLRQALELSMRSGEEKKPPDEGTA